MNDWTSGDKPNPLIRRVPPHHQEAERCVVAACFDAFQGFDELEIALRPEDFYSTWLRSVWQTMVSLRERKIPIEHVAVKNDLGRRGVPLDGDRVTELLLLETDTVPTAANLNYYAKIVVAMSRKRKLIEVGARIVELGYSTGKVRELTSAAHELLFAATAERQAQKIVDAEQLAREVYQHLTDPDRDPGVATGWFGLDRVVQCFRPGEMTVLAARPSMGKAQPLDARVLTPTGFVRMGDLSVGDRLASVDGKPNEVLGIARHGARKIYRITFSDGRSCEACAEHLWLVRNRKWAEPKVLQTQEIIGLLRTPSMEDRIWVDRFTGDWGADATLPIPPWLLGVLLGDGCLTGSSVRLSNPEEEIVQRALFEAKRVDPLISRRQNSESCVTFATPRGKPNKLLDLLRSLGIMGKKSIHKRVPASYMIASRGQRLELVRGLMDTDGWCEKSGTPIFSTSSELLAADFVDLVRGLGCLATTRTRRPQYPYRGEIREGHLAYRITVRCESPASLFWFDRKRSRVRTRGSRLTIASVIPSRRAVAQCIRVSHPSSLYMTDGFVPTHNSALMNALAATMLRNGERVGICSLEMDRLQLACNAIGSRVGVDTTRIRSGVFGDVGALDLTVARRERQDTLDGIEWLSEFGDRLAVFDGEANTVTDLARVLERMVTRNRIRFAAIDYMQLMDGSDASRGRGRYEEVTEISKGLKRIAKRLKIHVMVLAQLNRKVEERRDKKPIMADLRDSGQVEQDADVIMLLHRPEDYWPGKPEHEGVAILDVCKNRNGPTGVVRLQFTKEYTRFEPE